MQSMHAPRRNRKSGFRNTQLRMCHRRILKKKTIRLRRLTDRIIKRPSAMAKRKSGGVRVSNSFDAIGLEDTIEEFTLGNPTTFLDVLEKERSTRDKRKMKIGESEKSMMMERGFSPTTYSAMKFLI
jgi:hypothetical protein